MGPIKRLAGKCAINERLPAQPAKLYNMHYM